MTTRVWTNPRTGQTEDLPLGDHSAHDVHDIAARSLRAWQSYRHYSAARRAAVLRIIADALDASSPTVVPLADEESALGEPRLVGEVARTSFQLRMFAEALDNGTLLSHQSDEAVAGPPPAGRPELVRTYVPLGPVAVFGASNFPFAFGVLGGDCASALAAGCTVVVKEHSAHPRLSAALVDIAREALAAASEDPDIVLSVRGTQAGADLVTAAEIAAVGFTGSVSGGRFLFDRAVSRPKPIPFYGELGSINPVAISRKAAQARGGDIGREFAESLMLGAGQFCTKPSILIYPAGSEVLEAATAALRGVDSVALLTPKIADAYDAQIERMSAGDATNLLETGPLEKQGAWVRPALFHTTVAELMTESSPLREECFGPSAVVVAYTTDDELLALCAHGEGVLVGCVHGEDDDELAGTLVQILATRAGRVVWNGWPTGVSVAPAQMHGGPYPASTVPGATSVGVHAAARFARPVVFQSVPEALQPRR